MELFSKELNNKLKEHGHFRFITAGSTLSKSDTPARPSIPIVLSGSLRVTRRDNHGKEIFLYYIKPGQTCIMSFMAGLSNDKNEICAIVEEDAEVIMLPSVAAAEWIRVDPEWYNFVFKIFHTRFTELLAIIDIVAFQKMDDRIMDILKKKTEIHRSNELNITHQQLAVELGTSREVTSRLLKQLEKQQYIKLSRGKVIMTECKYSSRGLEKI